MSLTALASDHSSLVPYCGINTVDERVQKVTLGRTRGQENPASAPVTSVKPPKSPILLQFFFKSKRTLLSGRLVRHDIKREGLLSTVQLHSPSLVDLETHNFDKGIRADW